MFKNSNYTYQNTNYNQANISNCKNIYDKDIAKCTYQSNEKIMKLNLIMERNENELNKYFVNEENDRDLTDFKFSVNDKVKIE